MLEHTLVGKPVQPGLQGWSLYERYLDRGDSSTFLVADPMRPDAVDILALVASLNEN